LCIAPASGRWTFEESLYVVMLFCLGTPVEIRLVYVAPKMGALTVMAPAEHRISKYIPSVYRPIMRFIYKERKRTSREEYLGLDRNSF
jgi:hypothetical protein